VRQRCIVTSIDPDTGDQDLEVFRRIRRRFGNEVGLNCWVIRPGVIHLGDPVSLQPITAEPNASAGGSSAAPTPRSSPERGDGQVRSTGAGSGSRC
jgi:hypothetical protein